MAKFHCVRRAREEPLQMDEHSTMTHSNFAIRVECYAGYRAEEPALRIPIITLATATDPNEPSEPTCAASK